MRYRLKLATWTVVCEHGQLSPGSELPGGRRTPRRGSVERARRRQGALLSDVPERSEPRPHAHRGVRRYSLGLAGPPTFRAFAGYWGFAPRVCLAVRAQTER